VLSLPILPYALVKTVGSKSPPSAGATRYGKRQVLLCPDLAFRAVKGGPEARAITSSSACSIGLSETETHFFSDNPRCPASTRTTIGHIRNCLRAPVFPSIPKRLVVGFHPSAEFHWRYLCFLFGQTIESSPPLPRLIHQLDSSRQ
jgi:hypothetical protein